MAAADPESTGSQKVVDSIYKVKEVFLTVSEKKLFSGPIIKDSGFSSRIGEWIKEEKLLSALRASLDKLEFDKKYQMLRSPDFHQNLGVSEVQKLQEEKALLEQKVKELQEEQAPLETNILTKLDSFDAYFDNRNSKIGDVLL